jgi:tRNA (guanine10-N2)-methyltransferase
MLLYVQEVAKYDLKKRLYIGPTSLDHHLAFLMGNASHVRKGSLVLDPFVGTASILVWLLNRAQTVERMMLFV